MSMNGRSQHGETKMQAVIDAAADPHSSVTAEQAEKTVLLESKKAGAEAFMFDPNASPEEKAQRLHDRMADGIYSTNRKPSAVGIVSDMAPDSPSKYDLPSPTFQKKVEEAPPPPSEVPDEAPGHYTEAEKQRWVERVGWAPRFGEGDMTEAEKNETMLDKATALETKLDDAFFGDWYHNAGVIIFACLSSWVVALLGGGLGWVFIVMAFCATYYRTSIRRVRRNFRDDVQREYAKARLETDVESLEWINSFLVKFWPIYAPHICEAVIVSVDQVLSTSTPAFLDSLRMKFFTLGTKPPRLEHVKTYPKAEDDTVLMDWKFSFTPGDRMDMTARQLKEKINPKVILAVRIGVGIISKELDVIVEDFACSGLMRVKVKLQQEFPHIEKVEICFLGKPDIDYVCKPLGGDTLGFDINFIPGLEGFILEMIHGNLAPIMYEPNVFPIEIAKMLAGNPVDQAIGVVAVTLHGATGLKNPEPLGGSTDPYCVVSLNNRDELGKTKTIKSSTNPRWNETIFVIVSSFTDALTLSVFDYNEFRKDKELGTATFALDRLEQVKDHENLTLDVLANGKTRGVVLADIRFFQVLEGLKLADGKQEPPPESNTGIARFTVEQAKDLDESKSLVGQLNPYAVLLLNGHEIHQSKKLKRTNNPIWPDAAKEFLVTDRKSAKVGLVVKDDRGLTGDQVLGTFQMKMEDMVQMLDQGKEWFNLSGAKKGRVKLQLQWKPVALTGIAGGTGGYVTPIGAMRFHIQSAREVKNVETMGKSDPYCRVLVSGIERAKTVTFERNLNPDWDEVVYVPVHSQRERIMLEVMDYQNIGKDRTLGFVEISASDYVQKDDNGEYQVHDSKRQRSEPLRQLGGGSPKGKLNFTVAFYPTLNVADPEEEEEEADGELIGKKNGMHSRNTSKASVGTKSLESAANEPAAQKVLKESDTDKLVDAKTESKLEQAEEEVEAGDVQEPKKIKLTPEELTKYETGLLIFKLIEGQFAHPDLHLEVLMDDMAFPSYSFSKATSKNAEFSETGDAIVRELDVSRVTLRLAEKEDKRGGSEGKERVFAKLSGQTLSILQRCLYTPTDLTLQGDDGTVSRVKVMLKYLPLKMNLDPSESVNNMGSLRVDVLSATGLPSADRNGFSDPYCKFDLNGETIFKSKIQKKNLNPVWNESFEIPIKSRTAAKFKVIVMDWDMGGGDDLLGAADINLEMLEAQRSQELTLPLDGKSGTIRLRLLFKSAYVTRSRQTSSTFSGSVGPAGKIIGAPVKGVTKVGGAVGDGVLKGTTFLRHGFKSSKDTVPTVSNFHEALLPDGQTNGYNVAPSSQNIPIPSIETPSEVSNGAGNYSTLESVPSTPSALTSSHNRTVSTGQKSIAGSVSPGKADTGTAFFTILSATGFPHSAKVQVHIKQVSPKGSKEVHKTKGVKSSSGDIHYETESFKVSCAADTQFQIQVKDDKLFGSDTDLGEAPFYINDSPSGSENTVKVGEGTVVVRTSFAHADGGSMKDSPRGNVRKSFLSRKEGSRQATPTPS